jgi:hypothetical protein
MCGSGFRFGLHGIPFWAYRFAKETVRARTSQLVLLP